jgi:hypothetical protein
VSGSAALAQASRPALDSATVAGFRWRTVGPANFEGRVADIAGIPVRRRRSSLLLPAAASEDHECRHDVPAGVR